MKWGIQGFLNPAESEDSGWYKIGLRGRDASQPGHLKDYGHSITFKIADCSNTIHLDMGWGGLWLSHLKETELSLVELKQIDYSLETLNSRRKKITKFVDAMVRAGDEIKESFDKDEKALLELRAKVVEAKNKEGKK